MDTSDSEIVFDGNGNCNHCNNFYDNLSNLVYKGDKSNEIVQKLVQKIKKSKGKGKFDCVIGVSGGTDSSFMLAKAIEWGLRPLAAHYDNTWNTAIATENIRKVTSKLNIDLFTYVVDNKESDDVFLSFFLSGVTEFDASTDIAYAQVLRKVAAQYKIKYILEGHSFKAEGISPQGNNYFDGKYILDIHRNYGRMKLKTLPVMTFYQFLKWAIVYRQQFIRPLWYIEYSKPEARKRLISETGWKYYGGHHLENRATAFAHKVYLPQKYNIDHRNWSLAAEVRSGVLSRNDALKIYSTPIEPDSELIEYVIKRMGITEEEYKKIMKGAKRTFRDFKTYKKRFERLRPLFYILAKANLVPMSFYLKYCFPLPE